VKLVKAKKNNRTRKSAPTLRVRRTGRRAFVPRALPLAKSSRRINLEEPAATEEVEERERTFVPRDAEPYIAQNERLPYDGNTAFNLYLREVGQTALLTIQEENELAARIKKGDKKARERMIKANLRLVVKIAREYEDYGMPLLDLINEGNMGLHQAHVALVDEVEQRHAVILVFARDFDDEAQVGLDHPFAGFLVALLDARGQLILLLDGEQRGLADFAQIEVEGGVAVIRQPLVLGDIRFGVARDECAFAFFHFFGGGWFFQIDPAGRFRQGQGARDKCPATRPPDPKGRGRFTCSVVFFAFTSFTKILG